MTAPCSSRVASRDARWEEEEEEGTKERGTMKEGTPSAGAFRDACVKAFADDDVRAALRRFKKRINE